MVDSLSSIASGKSVEQAKQVTQRNDKPDPANNVKNVSAPVDKVEISEEAVKRYAQDARSELAANSDQSLGLDKNFDVSV